MTPSLTLWLRRSRAPLALGSLLCFAALAAAYVSQHTFGMLPCPWCALQRLIFLAMGITLALGAAVHPASVPRPTLLGINLALALCGVAAALWQHFKAAASASCNLTFADRILDATGAIALAPKLFEPRASCADAAVNLMGVPYDFWSLALFLALGALSALALFLPAKAKRSGNPALPRA